MAQHSRPPRPALLPDERYLALLEHIPVVVYIADFDETGTLRYVSPRIEALTGRTPEELLADQEEWYRCVHPDDRERVRTAEANAYAAQCEFDCEYRLVDRDGAVSHVWERDVILRDDDGAPAYTQGVLLDVTSLREVEAELRAEHERAQNYLDVVGVAMLALDRDGRVTMLNRAGHELLGYEDGALIGADWFGRFVPGGEEMREDYHRSLDDRSLVPEMEHEILRRDGRRILVAWRMTILVDERGQAAGLLSSGVDVTERRRAQQQITHMAYHDHLTGLPNRAMLRDHLDLALARAARHGAAVALLYVDLDDFKLVNDGLGHAAGDDLLRMMSDRLRARLREEDLVAREGGDEFLVLLADLGPDAEQRALAVGEGIVAALRAPVHLGETEFEVNGSVGISIFPADAQDAEGLLAHADAAMYDAKAAGRGKVRVFRGGRPRSVERLSMGRRLRRALDGDELELHWQPIVDLQLDVLKGAEALVRWPDPERGLLTAAEFIGDIEAAGLLPRLDTWVVGALVEQRRAWNEQGLDPYVGINLGPRALSPRRIPALVEALADGGLDLARVTVEISETEVLQDDAASRRGLRRLVESGVTLALDDFGVAYSSLRRLRDLPVKWIKTDRSFLEGVPASREATQVLEAILQLLEALDARVIVEGVEEPGQLAWLRELGVEAAQGYLLGRPGPAAALDALLRASPESQLATAPPRSLAPRG